MTATKYLTVDKRFFVNQSTAEKLEIAVVRDFRFEDMADEKWMVIHLRGDRQSLINQIRDIGYKDSCYESFLNSLEGFNEKEPEPLDG